IQPGIVVPNARLDQNESLTITETLSGTSCTDVTVTSAIVAHWGCEGPVISTSTSYASITVDFQSPNLKLTTTESLDACFGAGEGSEQSLMLRNSGNGLASGIEVEIFKSSGSGYDQDIFSRFDENSLEYKVGNSGAWTSVSNLNTVTTQNTGDYACLGANPVGKMTFTLPDLAPGDTAFVRWDMYACCIQTCEDDALKGWEADVSYTDVCGTLNYDLSKTGQDINRQFTTFFTETPIDLTSGAQEIFVFNVSSFDNTLPAGNGAHYTATFTLDPGLVYEDIRFHSNGTDWLPTNVNYNAGTNVVVAEFPVPAPFVVAKSALDLTLSGNCGTAGWKTVELDWDYTPDISCTSGCSIPLACDVQVTTYLHCPVGPCNGLNVYDFALGRVNFGAPDNNLDGNPDASGALNMAEVKARRAMVGDTIRGTASALVEATSDTWAFAGFSSDIDYGSVLDFLSATLTIYDASAGTNLTVTGLTPSLSTNGNQREFSFDLSAANLANLNPALNGYLYSGGDSITLDVDYRLSANVPGLIQEVTFLNDFYVSDFANPTAAQQISCSFRHGRMTFIGYAWRNTNPNNTTVNSCTKTINQWFGMSIGDVGSNYAGGNLFPYEYRHWSTTKEIKVVLPPNYSHVNTTIKHYRTRRTNSIITETVSTVVPDAINGDTLYFNIAQYYTTGQMTASDDGYHGQMRVEVAPTCDVPQNTYQDIVWTINYKESNSINGVESGYISASGPDRIRYRPSSFSLLSNNPIQDALTRKISWDFKVQNTSSSGADFAWVHIDAPTNIVIDSIVNDANGQALTTQSDLFLLGTVNANSTADLTIFCTVSGCDTVQFTAFSGFECTGYPASFADFTCGYEQLPLYVEPKPSGYQTRISAELMQDPCLPQVEITVDITSVKLGHMFDMSIDFLTADTNKIKVIAGSSQFQYNVSNNYAPISDPLYAAGFYHYDINDYNASFATNGIPGVLDINNNRYRLKATLELGPQFSPGDFLQIQINGANACDVPLQTINLAYDPNAKFDKDNTAGLHLDPRSRDRLGRCRPGEVHHLHRPLYVNHAWAA
ncbi:MAG: hypothetical protein AAF570_07240, partial [Bacteroidota bacterium]